MDNFDFSGWATRANLKCSDGRIIRPDAFKHNDGQKVPLVWNHKHGNPEEVLGHALLENRGDGVYAYCKFNNTESGKTAKILVQHGDVDQLSIYANQLKQQGPNVIHGNIREVSLVLAGANPGAYIESVMMHGEESEEAGIIYTGEFIDLAVEHSDDEPEEKPNEEDALKETEKEEVIEHSDEKKDEPEKKEKTVAEVIDTMNEEQQTVLYGLLGQVLGDEDEEDDDEEEDNSKGGNKDMKHNVFDQDEKRNEDVLTHSDQAAIIEMAKMPNVGSLRHAMEIYAEEELKHGIDEIEKLFPEYQLTTPGAPELLERDQTWVGTVMNGVHKSPISRIRTRQADARAEEIKAKGYKKGEQKTVSANLKLISRTTDPQTVYRKDELHRDDIIDITEFDVVEYQYGIMRRNLEEEIAAAILVGDGRDDSDANKISEDHIRSIWNDEDLYTIKAEVDIAKAKAELQGSDTSKHFGDNYIYAEAIITAALYSREKYKGSGNLRFFCTPHLLNVMLLARDLNGRRIYDSKTDLAAALNVVSIDTVEQFEGKIREDSKGNKKKLLGIFVNLSDYQVGSTKGGEITRFNQFDIDFNKEKYLLETRLSGALTKVYSAIVLEEPVNF